MPGGSAASQSLHMAKGKTFCLAGDTALSRPSCLLPCDELLVGKKPSLLTDGQILKNVRLCGEKGGVSRHLS